MALFTIDVDPLDTSVEAAVGQARAFDNTGSVFDHGVKFHPFTHVRRPHRGLQITDDTYATIQVVTGKGNQPIIDAGSALDHDFEGFGSRGVSSHYSNFIVQNLTSAHSEKMQVIETFGEHFVFFYGQRPITLTVSGALLKSADFGWRSEFMTNYERYLRGTRLVENKARCLLSWEDVLVDGFLTSVNLSEGADAPYLVNFQFSMILTGMRFTSDVGDPNFPKPLRTSVTALTPAQQASATNLATLDTDKVGSNRSLSEAFRESEFIAGLKSARSTVRNFHRKMQQYVTGRFERVPVGFHGMAWQIAGDREKAPRTGVSKAPQYGRLSEALDERPAKGTLSQAVSLGSVPGFERVTEAQMEATARQAFLDIGLDPDENRKNQEVLHLVTRGTLAVLGRGTLALRSRQDKVPKWRPTYTSQRDAGYGLVDV